MKKTITNFFVVCGLVTSIGLFAQSNVINTVVGTHTGGYNGDNIAATSAELYFPYGICLDATGNMYIAEWGNHRVRKVDATTGIITTIAGTGAAGHTGDKGPATSAEIWGAYDVRLDAAGNVYFADANANCIRKITSSTGMITTIAGKYDSTGPAVGKYDSAGYNGDGIAATIAKLNYPTGIVLDPSGNIYIADQYNNRIRKVTASTGIITTVVGTGKAGYTGDGNAATNAEISAPARVMLDASGDLYFSDGGNNVIRKVTVSTGIINTVVGTGSAGYSGDGAAATSATLSDPSGIIFDATGNMYIADASNNVIREVIYSTGIITTLAGNGTQGYSGNGGQALNAEFFHPLTMAIYNNTGNMLIDDDENWVIREVNAPLAVDNISSSITEVNIYPNPASERATLTFSKNLTQGSVVKVYNLMGQVVYSENIKAAVSSLTINTSILSQGVYLLKVNSIEGSIANKKFEVIR